MPREFGRNVRIAQTIKRIVAPAVAAIARDAGLGMATVTKVEVAADLSQARVLVSIYMAPSAAAPDIDALKAQAPELRQLVARELRLKKTPAVVVALDESIARVARISELLDERRPRR